MLFVACEKGESLGEIDRPDTVQTSSDDMLKLGEKITNPYTLANMQEALDNLTASKKSAPKIKIETTNLYVRFLPKNGEELQRLYNDPALLLWDYPLDYKVAVQGHYYHDPSIPDTLPTYQYTVVKPDYKFTDIAYEVIEEVFMPEEYEATKHKSEGLSGFFILLENEALRLTDNEEYIVSQKGSKWTPKGTITVDEVVGGSKIGTLPVKNIKVKGKRLLKFSSDYTDVYGRYELSSFRGKVDFSMEFESDRVKITDWWGTSRNYNGANNWSSEWNENLPYWSEAWVNATLLNAAYECRKQVNKYGLTTPLPTSFWAGGEAVNKLNIRAKYGSGRSYMSPVTANEIKIYSDNTYTNGISFHRKTDDLYSVLFHELGHSIHYTLKFWDLNFVNSTVKESWATYIQWLFLKYYYPNSARDKQGDNFADQTNGYTAVFIDLVDTTNQRLTYGGNLDYPDDDVKYYSAKQLEEALKSANNLTKLRDNMKTYTNSTRPHLDDLFEFYIDVEANYAPN